MLIERLLVGIVAVSHCRPAGWLIGYRVEREMGYRETRREGGLISCWLDKEVMGELEKEGKA